MSLIKIQNDDFYFNDFCNYLLLSKKKRQQQGQRFTYLII